MTQIDAMNFYIVGMSYFILMVLAYVVYNYISAVINERRTFKNRKP